jgi:hypothetical protein
MNRNTNTKALCARTQLNFLTMCKHHLLNQAAHLVSPFSGKMMGNPNFSLDIQYTRPDHISQEWHQWPTLKDLTASLLFEAISHPTSYILLCARYGEQGPVYSLKENRSNKWAGCWEIGKKERNQLINYHSERHCVLSGRFLGMGSAVTYLWRHFWAFPDASEDDELSAPSPWPRPWNFAKRLITENLSRSWHSNLKSETDALLSNLHPRRANNKW